MKSDKAIMIAYTSDGIGHPVVVEYFTHEDRMWIDWDLFITTIVEIVSIVKLGHLPFSDLEYDLMIGFESLLRTNRVRIEIK